MLAHLKITFTIDIFLQLIDSLSYSKQNVFHWHLTDSQSFPLLMPSLPDFVRYGAYKPDQVYMPDQVQTYYLNGPVALYQVLFPALLFKSIIR